MLTKLTRFEEQLSLWYKILEHTRKPKINTDILNDSYMNLIMGISADQLRHLVFGLARKVR